MADLPDNIDLNWIGRKLLALEAGMRVEKRIGDAAMIRRDIEDLREEVRAMRENVEVIVATTLRRERSLGTLRDDIRSVFDLMRDVRARITVEEG